MIGWYLTAWCYSQMGEGSAVRLTPYRQVLYRECSDAYFRPRPIMDRLKSPKIDCFTPPPPSPFWPLVRLKYSSGGLVSRCSHGAADKPAIISQQIQTSVHRKRQTRCPVHPDRRGTAFWLKQVAMYSARSMRIKPFLCRLCS